MSKRTEKPAGDPRIERMSIGDLIPDPANVRKHTDRNRSAVTSSMKRFGAARSIVLDRDNVVIAGNQTIASAADAGISDVLVVDAGPDQLVAVRRSDGTKPESTGYAIADNRSAELAEWDFEGLSRQLGALKADGLDLDDLGWAPHEVEPLLAAEWTPPPQTGMPGEQGNAGQGQDAHDHPYTVSFAPEAWRVVKEACDKIRKSEEDDSITDQRAIELIAADFLSGA